MEWTYVGYLFLGVITPRYDIKSVRYLLGVISIGLVNISEYKHLGLTQPYYDADISRDLQVRVETSRISSPRRSAELCNNLLGRCHAPHPSQDSIRIESQEIRDKLQIHDLWDKMVIDMESNLKKHKRNQLRIQHSYSNSQKI
jgi:hypothetical protein